MTKTGRGGSPERVFEKVGRFIWNQRFRETGRVSDNHYATNLSDAAWALLAPLLPAGQPGGRPRATDIRAVIDAIFYLLRTGCQWRLLGSFQRGAPFTTISACGRAPVCGLACNERSTSKLGGKPAGRHVPRW